MIPSKLSRLVYFAIALSGIFSSGNAFADGAETFQGRDASGQTVRLSREEIVRLYKNLTIPVGQNGRFLLNVVADSDLYANSEGKKLPLQGRTVRATYEILNYRHDTQTPTNAIFTLKDVASGRQYELVVRLNTGWENLPQVMSKLERSSQSQKVYFAISDRDFPLFRLRAGISPSIPVHQILTQVGDEVDSLSTLSMHLVFFNYRY